MERQNTPIGRYTDFAEILAFTFRGDLWERFWQLIEPDRNPWGWGYDEVAYAVCGFRRMAIIDCEVVKHTRKGSYHAAVAADHRETHRRYRRYYISRKKTLGEISDQPWRKYLVTPLWLYLHLAFARSFALPGAVGLRRLIRACRERLGAAFGTRGTGDTPIPTGQERVCLSDRPPAASHAEPAQESKHRRRTPKRRRAKAKVRK
jgi:hypothetical protein